MRISKHSIATLKLMLLLTLLPQAIHQPAIAKSAKQCNYVCTKNKCKLLPVCAAQKAAMKEAIAAAAITSKKLEDDVTQEKAGQLLDATEESLCLVNSAVSNCKPPKASTKNAKAAWKDLGEMTLSAFDRIERIRRLSTTKAPRTTLQYEAHELVCEVYGLNTLLESSVP
jgi:hypothetical protein